LALCCCLRTQSLSIDRFLSCVALSEQEEARRRRKETGGSEVVFPAALDALLLEAREDVPVGTSFSAMPFITTDHKGRQQVVMMQVPLGQAMVGESPVDTTSLGANRLPDLDSGLPPRAQSDSATTSASSSASSAYSYPGSAQQPLTRPLSSPRASATAGNGHGPASSPAVRSTPPGPYVGVAVDDTRAVSKAAVRQTPLSRWKTKAEGVQSRGSNAKAEGVQSRGSNAKGSPSEHREASGSYPQAAGQRGSPRAAGTAMTASAPTEKTWYL
jgi:hypothetical protein